MRPGILLRRLAVTACVLLLSATVACGPEGSAAPSAVPPLVVTPVSLSSPVSRGSHVTISVQTAPSAKCVLGVRYNSGLSKARRLGPKTADQRGHVSWTWPVGAAMTPGTWAVAVTCAADDQQRTLRASFVVR